MTSVSGKYGSYDPTGYQMINSIEIENFRCYRSLRLDQCKRLNVIVGDSGSGKTTLLEAIFMALASTSEIAVRMRQQRGLDGQFSGPAARIFDAMFGDFFRNNEYRMPVRVSLNGFGEEHRTLVLSRGRAELRLPIGDVEGESSSGAFVFQWTDHVGRVWEASPVVDNGQVRLPETGEDLPNFFQFGASANSPSVEAAGRFSELSKKNKHRHFVDLFTKEYPWIQDLSVEVHGGAPSIFAAVDDAAHKIPLANVSGGINRIVSILLAIASRPRSVVTVDEIEGGIFWTHQTGVWRALIAFMRQFDSQLFVTTHSKENLQHLIEAAGDKLDDIALWRIERTQSGDRELNIFSGDTLRAGLNAGIEARGGSDAN